MSRNSAEENPGRRRPFGRCGSSSSPRREASDGSLGNRSSPARRSSGAAAAATASRITTLINAGVASMGSIPPLLHPRPSASLIRVHPRLSIRVDPRSLCALFSAFSAFSSDPHLAQLPHQQQPHPPQDRRDGQHAAALRVVDPHLEVLGVWHPYKNPRRAEQP